MTLSNLLPGFFNNYFYVYYQMLFVCVLITLIASVFKFSETKVIKSGIYLFALCLVINFGLSLFSGTYWYFILHWFLASLCFFVFWYLVLYMCEQYGQPYSGDGGMVMILPVYCLFFALFSSLLIKGIIKLIQLF